MKKIGIIGAMGSEIAHLQDMLEGKTEQVFAGRTFYSGTIGGTQTVLACSGIGKVNAAMTTQLMIDHYAPDAVINTGIAGGAHGVKVREVVVSTEATYHDMDLRILALGHPHLRFFAADETLVRRVEEACAGKLACHRGRIVSGDQFIADAAVKADIVSRLDPYAIEMEGAAVAHVCAANGLPFAVVRSISDNADDSADMDYESFERLAAQDAAELVAAVLSEL